MQDCSFCGQPTRWAEILDDDRTLCPACRPILFFEEHLTLTGDFAGQPFKLMGWLKEILREVFGVLDEDGLRRYRDVYTEVPTGNSKTTFCAGIVLFFLACDQTPGTEIYSAASAKEQAAITFRMAHQMVVESPTLGKLLTALPSTKRIVRRDDPTSFYAAISADGDVHDGINPSFVVRDELHRWRTRKALALNEVLERKIVKRKNPLIWDITTAGDTDESPLCWRRHEYTRQIEEHVFEDRRFYGRIFAADPKRIESEPDYWKSREARVLANPSHEDNPGGYIKDSTLADLCTKAENDPHVRSEYLRFHLNYWGQQDLSVIDLPKWIECGGGVDLRTWPEYDIDLLISKWGLVDKECYVGIDASWTTDLTALTVVFPFDGDPWSILSFFWMAEGRVKAREREDKVPYSDWVRKKFIETTPGNSINQSSIKDRIRWACQMFNVREVPYDPWNFRQSATDLFVDEQIPMAELRQNFANLSEATKELLARYLDRNIRHGNNPVLNWNAKCLSLLGDHKDNVQPSKPERTKSSKRIDGISATVTAMARAIVGVSNGDSYPIIRSVG